MISNTLATGVQGILDGMAGMEHAARRIARAGTEASPDTAGEGTGLVQPVLDLQLYERSVEASARVVKTADETLGTLLDIRV